LPSLAAGDLLDSLRAEQIAGVRINLNPWGARIGFEAGFRGEDPRLEPLLAALRESAPVPGKGHKCANAGAIRLRTTEGRVIGFGLLPGHEPGLYEVRVYDGDRLVELRRVDRARLLAALDGLGLPMDDPAFRE